MIAPSAIKAFLDRSLDDHNWLKRASDSRVRDVLNKLTPRPPRAVFEEFGHHQRVGFLLGVSYPQFFFIYDMGTGKSALSAILFSYHYDTRLIQGLTVIFAPTDAAVLGWEDEINKWTPNLPYRLLLGSSEDKWRALRGFKRGLVVVTYVGYSAMVSELRSVKNQQRKKRVPVKELIDRVAGLTDGLNLDESTNVGNFNLSYECVRPLSFAARARYALSGRPFGRDPQKIWPQMFLVDHGASLSPQVGLFREAFFTKKKRFWGGPGAFDWVLNKKLEPEFARAIANRSLEYSIDECVDMPERISTIRRVDFPGGGDMEAYYKRVVAELVGARGDYREVENAFMKMRQIASGFLGFVNDETGEKAMIEFKANPKLDEVMYLIEQEVPEDSKFIIWHEYTWTGARLCRELASRKIKHGWLWGGTSAAAWAKMKDQFDNGDLRGLVINHKKGAFALNLQRANYDFVVESPVAPDARAQLDRRTWRQGQTKTVRQYDIVVRNSADEKILRFHREGNNLFSALVSNPQKVLGL